MLKILEMEAVFGKLDGDILSFEDKLNVITAPNEWGKSTWCAFLTAMLYGIDTRDRTTKTDLADKEHYAPWSGKPMSGRIIAEWNGRKIAIYRSTSGRIPMGVFQAFDMTSGLPVEELTAANCGEQLLGVEKSVFLRSNFIHQGDMPMDDDENLRKRLHNLVSAGEDTADRLTDRLQELKNKLRYRKSGLLPQAEAELLQQNTLAREAEELTNRIREQKEELDQVRLETEDLQNHLDALAYSAYLETEAKIRQELDRLDACERAWNAAGKQCEGLEPEQTIRENLSRAWTLQETVLPVYETKVEKPEMPPDASQIAGAKAAAAYLKNRTATGLLLVGMVLAFLACGVCFYMQKTTYAYLSGAIGAGFLLVYIIILIARANRKKQILEAFGGDPLAWLLEAQQQMQRWEHYKEYEEAFDAKMLEVTRARAQWDRDVKKLTGGIPLGEYIRSKTEALNAWQRREQALREYQRQGQYADMLQQTLKPVPAPKRDDVRTESEEDTRLQLKYKERAEQNLMEQIAQLRGKREHYPSVEKIQSKQRETQQKIWKMEDTYRALEKALETAEETEKELSSRFAPKISKRAGMYLEQMTGGKYATVQLQQDLSLLAAAEGENRLRSPLWRSSGTEDQLYLAVRLAVAEELSPETPLILDDAFSRFDDTRLKAALDLLESMNRQVILFSCQEREKTLKKQEKSVKKLLTFF